MENTPIGNVLGRPQGCIKDNGGLCDGSAPPLERIKQCLRDRKRVAPIYFIPICIGAAVAAYRFFNPEACFGGAAIRAWVGALQN